MEDHNNKSKHPNLPPNYVTLLQLQESWEAQQKKHKQNEQLQQQPQQPPNQNQCQQTHPIPTAAEVPDVVTALTVSIVGQSDECERAGKGTKKKKKGRRNKKKKATTASDEEKVKMKVKEVQADQVAESEGRAPVVKTGRANVAVWGDRREKGVVVEYRPKIRNDVVKKSDRAVKIEKVLEIDRTVEIEMKKMNVMEEVGRTVESERKLVNAVEESDGTVEIEQKMGDISVKEENVDGESQIRVITRRNREYTGHGGGFHRSSGRFRGGGGSGKHYGRSWHGRGGDWRSVRGGEQRGTNTGMEWVRKEEVAAAGVMRIE